MRCRLCRDRAGWWRRRCDACTRLWTAWQLHRHDGLRRVLAAFADTGLPAAEIERFLDAEPEPGKGTVRDLIAADMTNELLAALGQRGEQTGVKVKRLRERGGWRSLDRRPED